MPELPEVTLTVKELNKYLKGATITNIVGYGRYAGNKFNIGTPIKITSINNKGKFIYFTLANGQYIFNTLGLSGHWSLEKKPNVSIELQYKKSGRESSIYLIDQLHYATFGVHNDIDSKLKSIGPDMNNTDFKTFQTHISKYPNKNIATVLMDQGVVSGVGNYIRSQALYLGKISPYTKVKDLSDSKLESLYKAIKTVINRSYKMGGASVTFYRHLDGSSGEYDKEMYAYGRDTDSKGNPVKKDKMEDRTIYWVPAVQK